MPNEDKKADVVVIRTPLRIEEPTGREVTAFAVLLDKGRRITTSVPEYRDESGLFLAHQPIQVIAPRLVFVDCSTLKELPFFAAPGGDKLAPLRCGEQVTFVERQPGWVRIRTKDNVEGYASGWFVSELQSSASSELVFRIPTTVLPNEKRKVKSRICVIAPDDALLLDCTREFTVKFPKLKGQKK